MLLRFEGDFSLIILITRILQKYYITSIMIDIWYKLYLSDNSFKYTLDSNV